jgi:predicted nucleic acid-binding protein
MSYLLDTNVISELIKATPNKRVLTWINEINESDLYLSVLTIGELRKGIERLDKSHKKSQLLIWLEQDLFARFSNRILFIDLAVAERWGRLSAANKTLPAIDSLIAATALHHDLTLVTRNVSDFDITTLEVLNPWE